MIDKYQDKKLALVVYTDGGAAPNPGPTGFGVHGYLYDLGDKTPIKEGIQNFFSEFFNSGDTNKLEYMTPTKLGYVKSDKTGQPKNPELKSINPIAYLDWSECYREIQTNNVGELGSVLWTYQMVLQHPQITSVTILLDSTYAMRVMTEFINSWKRNGWVKSDGNTPGNLEMVKAMDAIQVSLKDRGCQIKFEKVRGHSGDFGNDISDYLAGIGVRMSRDYVKTRVLPIIPADRTSWGMSAPKNYWKPDVARHPLMTFKRTLFCSQEGMNEAGTYFMIEPADEDMQIGKRANEAYAVVKLYVPCNLMESVIGSNYTFHQHQNRLMLARNERVYGKHQSRYAEKYGPYSYFPSGNQRATVFCDLQPMAVEHNPPMLMYRVTEIMLLLDSILEAYTLKTNAIDATNETPASNLVLHDVTSEFFNLVTKKVKGQEVTVKELRPEFVVGYTNHILQITEEIDGKEQSLKVPMALGMDLPNRNYLKRLEGDDPTITLVTYRDSDQSLRYAFVVECKSGVGIFSNYHCDRIFLKPS